MAMRLSITPEQAIDHLDEVASKYLGTRDDHQVLGSSVMVLREVVRQWRRSQELSKAQPSNPSTASLIPPDEGQGPRGSEPLDE